MSRSLLLSVLTVLAVILAACSSAVLSTSTPVANAPAVSSNAAESNEALARTDSQGSVVFVITPLNLGTPGETLDFDVSMNTHSVDLSWPLDAQSTLTTDTGLEVKGLRWPIGSGHHYEGTLAFPEKTVDGKSVLEGAKKLTLTIRDAAAPVRIFEWQISP